MPRQDQQDVVKMAEQVIAGIESVAGQRERDWAGRGLCRVRRKAHRQEQRADKQTNSIRGGSMLRFYIACRKALETLRLDLDGAHSLDGSLMTSLPMASTALFKRSPPSSRFLFNSA
jgi:hypothetical protein